MPRAPDGTLDSERRRVDRFKAGDGLIDIGTFQSASSVILP